MIAADAYPFFRCMATGRFTINRAAQRSIHKGDALHFTVNRMSAHGTLVLITCNIFPVMRLFFLRKAAALPEMILAVS